MSTRRFRLTKTAKVLLFVIILALIGGLVGVGIKTGVVKTSKDKTIKTTNTTQNSTTTPVADADGNVMNTDKTNNDTINVSLDEWIGWKSCIDANGGLTTQPGSIYDKLGIKVNISIINDATQSSNALISGKLDAAGYTINRTAFLSKKFKDAGLNVVMPFITNFSNGGDGIIAKSSITSVSDLVTAKVGVPQFSEAHSLMVWLADKSDLSQTDKDTIINNLIFFETPDEAAKAFFAGQIDVAATWEPYLTQAKNMTDAHILFSTASSSNLIMDGILFNEDFAKANPDVVSKFIDGALQASELYGVETQSIKKVMPMFATASDEDIKDNCEAAKLTTYADNIALFKGNAKTIYTDMCGVWKSIGEEVNEDLVETLFDNTYISALSDKYDATDVTKNTSVKVTTDNEETIKETKALLAKSTTINFISDTAKFLDPATASVQLDDFIKIANVLDGSIIEIAGNTNNVGATDPVSAEVDRKLSLARAEAVKNYFIMNGVDPERLIVIGNGCSNPVAPNDTEEHRAMNRRTDISFKVIEE